MKNLLWVFVLALTACSADVRRFVPPNVDLTQMAHLIGSSESLLPKGGDHLFIVSVDGKRSKSDWEVRSLPSDVYLTPGTHRFRVLYQHAGLAAFPRLEIGAKAGVAFYIHCHSVAYGIRCWITEGKQDGSKAGRLLSATR